MSLGRLRYTGIQIRCLAHRQNLSNAHTASLGCLFNLQKSSLDRLLTRNFSDLNSIKTSSINKNNNKSDYFYSSNNHYCKNTMEGFVEIKEGSASMLYDQKEKVFYNKVQVFNRDMSIQVCNLFSSIREQEIIKAGKKFEGITILDALAATGLRSVRYLKEINNVKQLTINDILPDATTAARANCERNKVDMSKVTINTGDATTLMYQSRIPNQQFDIIDLDPYGSAVPFLDSAVQAVSDGGLLCVTCTDMTVLGGVYPEVCYSKYGCVSVKGAYVHELSLRILLHAIDSTANKYKRYIVPWISLSVDFYVRVFVRVFESPNEVKKAFLKRGLVLQSSQCASFYLQPFGNCLPGRSQKNESRSSKKKQAHFNDIRNPKYKAKLEAEAAALANGGGAPTGNNSDNLNSINDSTKDESNSNSAEAEVSYTDNNEDNEEFNVKQGGKKEAANNMSFWCAGSISECLDNSSENAKTTAQRLNGVSFAAPVWTTPAACEETDGRLKMGGPFWMQQLHQQEIVDELLRRIKLFPIKKEADAKSSGDANLANAPSTLIRIRAILTAISEEIKDIPLYYILPALLSQMRIKENISIGQMNAAIRSLGYRCSQFHREPMSLKTDAPTQVLWDIIRCQAEKFPPNLEVKKAFSETTLKMLNRKIEHRVDFDNLTIKRLSKETRYPVNPEKEWGPKRKAGRQTKHSDSAVDGDEDNDIDEIHSSDINSNNNISGSGGADNQDALDSKRPKNA